MNYLGLDCKEVVKIVDCLNDLLANYYIYYQNLWNFYWNVDGENFFDLYEKFEELYDDVWEKIDEIVECVVILCLCFVSKLLFYFDCVVVKELDIFEDEFEMVEMILENY